MRQITCVAALVAALSLAACGGGGGSGPATMPEQPVDTDSNGRADGITEQAAWPASVSLRRDAGNPTANEVLDILRVHASGGPWYGAGGDIVGERGLARFASPPTVRIAPGTNDHQRAWVHYAVALLNRALPYDKHLVIGSDAPRGILAEDGSGIGDISNIPDGQIVVEFYDSVPGLEFSGYAGNERYGGEQGLRAGFVLANREVTPPTEDRLLGDLHIPTLVHELMHAVGFYGHVGDGQSETPESVLNYNFSYLREPPPGFQSFNTAPFLPPLDIATLQALYTRLGALTEPEGLSATSLGPWETVGQSLVGRLEYPGRFGSNWIEFGVTHRNGVIVPWAISGIGGDIPGVGDHPRIGDHPGVEGKILATNPELFGTVTWDGELVGFTPLLRSVRGSAEISVNLDSMNGTAGFTDLQSWSVGVPPGEKGAGTQWGDGDLHYSITVAGNYLRSTGGDDGTVNGRFAGTDHQGVVGSVERADLTAAFGATR